MALGGGLKSTTIELAIIRRSNSFRSAKRAILAIWQMLLYCSILALALQKLARPYRFLLAVAASHLLVRDSGLLRIWDYAWIFGCRAVWCVTAAADGVALG